MAIWNGNDDKKNTEAIIAATTEAATSAVTAAIQTTMSTLTETIRTSIAETLASDAFISGITESVQIMREIAQTQQQVTVQLAEIAASIDKTAASVGQTAAAIKETTDTTFAGLQGAQMKLASLYDEIGNGATALVAREEGVVKSQKKVLDKMAEDMVELQKSWTDNYSRCAQQLNGDYDRILRQLEITNGAVETYSKALETAAGSMQAKFDDFNRSMTESIHGTFAIMDEQMAGVAETLAKTGQDISEAADRIPKAIRGLTK